jgi:hypothetical protein
MPDFLMFNEGKDDLLTNGLPATCTFELSTRQIGLGGTPLAAGTTHAGGYGLATGTAYASKTEAKPTPSAGVANFAQKSWSHRRRGGRLLDWPAQRLLGHHAQRGGNANSSARGTLQAGGTGRAMNTATHMGRLGERASFALEVDLPTLTLA